jgi:hypothetical protein
MIGLRWGAARRPIILDKLSGMTQKMTALERAFQLARSGDVSKCSEIVKALSREGYSSDQIAGPSLKRQLTDLIKTARHYPL